MKYLAYIFGVITGIAYMILLAIVGLILIGAYHRIVSYPTEILSSVIIYIYIYILWIVFRDKSIQRWFALIQIILMTLGVYWIYYHVANCEYGGNCSVITISLVWASIVFLSLLTHLSYYYMQNKKKLKNLEEPPQELVNKNMNK